MKLLFSILCCLFCSQLFGLKPVKAYLVTPDSFGLSYETLHINTKDSALLTAWKMQPAPAYDRKITIILAGGDAGNMSYLMQQAYMLVGNGFTVITFDYRGFGESSSFNINEKFLYYNEFASDLSAVIQWAKLNIKVNKTGVLAFSMGTAITAMAAKTDSLDFVIMEGLLYNPFIVAIRVKAIKGNEVLVPSGAENLPGLYLQIPCSMLIVAGKLDQVTVAGDSKTVTDQAGNRKLVIFKGGHLQGFEVLSKKNYGDTYIRHIIQLTKS